MEGQRDLVAKGRLINEMSLKNRLIEFFTKWEVLLVIIFIGVFVFFTLRTPYFLDWFNLMNASFQFSEKAIMALPMIFIIMCGDIDISIASIIALCAYVVGSAAQGGASIPSLIFLSLLVGTLAGLFNGLMITSLDMPAIAVTLATQSIFRGISIGLLGDQARTTFPEGFGFFGQEFIKGTIIPFEFVLYLVLMLVFAFILHKTTYGRRLYAIGNSAEAARFSGVNVKLTRVINFTITGFFCGLTAVLLASRILSVRSNIATGWDLEIITLVVLGGVAITGGRGTVFGVFLGSLLVGYLKFGMGLLKFSGTLMTIVIGSLLISAVLLPRLLDLYKANRKLRLQAQR
ncbi:MAG: ABC transporter permease [Sphaerochaeta sp.]|uniref:ABC transporter permease n=1 Tax=Sphaerochaeta sp. TaxID=1972642 RepID=UPI001D4C738E|nr:ABC transporter permease [uncultured Sphaerochaeta sp.]MDD3057787.1 ABC transporter permease [Sphaerochaeta sp.]MDD3928224.1 ABC transporter permease [Sphaerochaeta sp.]NCC12403.1 ABC transporter permease [Spirochaetia bacterium]NCC88910.1 ABC transporter permease [Spirochaetia bacterium]